MKNRILQTLVMLVSLLLCTCTKDKEKGACGSGKEYLEYEYLHTDIRFFEVFTGTPAENIIFYFYVPGSPQKVQFFIASRVTQICAEDHMKIRYGYILTNEPSSLWPMKFFGEAYWATYSRDILLGEGILVPGTGTSNTMEVGFTQAFPIGPADVDLYMSVEFESFGSFTQDSTFFRKHIHELHISSEYDKF